MNNYEALLDTLFDEDTEGDRIFKGLFSQLYFEEQKLREAFFTAACEGTFFQLSESHFVSFPMSLIADEEYCGYVEVALDNFDGLENTGYIEVNRFYKITGVLGFWLSLFGLISLCPWELAEKYQRIVALSDVENIT